MNNSEQYILAQANTSIKKTVPYQAGKAIEEVERELGIKEIIKLASNENPLGASPLAMIAAQNALINIHCYPDASYHRLRTAIASYNDIDLSWIRVGNGSENCLEILIKIFLQPDHEAIVDYYAFATIPILILAYGASLIKIPSLNFKQNIDVTLNAINFKTKMIFVVNPNNPTGSYLSTIELLYLLNNTPKNIIVILDEAYYEYACNKHYVNNDYPNSRELIESYPNLVVVRTFSKVFGLAGLRLGYIMAHPVITKLFDQARLPFNLNSIATEAGIAALTDDEFLTRTCDLNYQGIQQLILGFNQLKLEFIPTRGNFITINTKHDGDKIFNLLLKEGIIVRPLVPYDLNSYLRITIGNLTQNEKLLSALTKVLKDV